MAGTPRVRRIAVREEEEEEQVAAEG